MRKKRVIFIYFIIPKSRPTSCNAYKWISQFIIPNIIKGNSEWEIGVAEASLSMQIDSDVNFEYRSACFKVSILDCGPGTNKLY